MLKAVIIDDEYDARYLLRKSIEAYFKIEISIIGEAHDCHSGIQLIKEFNPDIIFLDIQMPDGSGFDLLSQLKSLSFQIVFVTAYDTFAIKAIEFSAIGYLVKPINPELLKSTVNRVLSQNEYSNEELGIKVLLENHQSEQIRKIVVPHADGFTVVSLSDIIYLQSDRNYSQFVLTDKKTIVSSKNLGLYEKLLIDYGFFRIHQSYLVNLTHVKAYVRSEGVVQVSSGEKLSVARTKKTELQKIFI